MDIVTKEVRSRMMSGIGSRNTTPEMKVRSFLHRHGYRFRLHARELPGRPDIVLPRFKLCILIHGCFWHRHEGCQYATIPRTREAFWQLKFEQNVARDARNLNALLEKGWRVFELWECGLRGPDDDISWLLGAVPDKSLRYVCWPWRRKD